MSKALRLSEKWFRRGLWVVAVVFAGFLIDFINRPAACARRCKSPWITT
ncbi:MAG: hypothetical protein Q8K38_12195 [Burkholderiaceae bacterium]|nr:hypothetical protein [Burkholderiaceae bacterium]MDZ4138816.1 hypothetical protein [Erythrobacter sp.]